MSIELRRSGCEVMANAAIIKTSRSLALGIRLLPIIVLALVWQSATVEAGYFSTGQAVIEETGGLPEAGSGGGAGPADAEPVLPTAVHPREGQAVLSPTWHIGTPGGMTAPSAEQSSPPASAALLASNRSADISRGAWLSREAALVLPETPGTGIFHPPKQAS
jgi:hypothetical protein